MKKLLLILLLSPVLVFSQSQPEVWYFGYNAGLDFNSGSPVSFNGSAISQWEGNATACDTFGNVQFYSDGITVWDATNNVMQNGTGLLGNGSSTHSATVVPFPSHPEKYYLFTNTDVYSTNGFRYSIIDMSLNGGLGAVTATKNVLLLDSVTEECVTVPSADGWIWIITRQFGAKWFAYLIDSTTIHPPVISNVGTVCDPTQAQGVGYLKASPLNNKLALAKYGYIPSNSFFELYDFDNSTGELDNVFQLTLVESVYSCSFSPDGSRFYGAEWGSNLYQYDMTLINPVDIANSKTLVGTSSSNTSIGDLQIGPDGKIYAAIDNAAYLGVINDPNTLGSGCNFVEAGVWLGGHTTGIGLPSTIFFSAPGNVSSQAAFASTDTMICQKFCIDYTDQSLNSPVQWQWSFPGGIPSSSSDQNPTNICYDNAGQFDVTLITAGINGLYDTLTLTNFITVYDNPFAPVITQTGNILTSTPAISYQWQFNGVDIPGATNQSVTITQSGLYTVIISNDHGCVAQSSIDASVVGIDETTATVLTLSSTTSSGDFVISVLNGSGETLSVEVSNTIGQHIYSSREMILSREWKQQVDLKDQAKGVYYISVQTGKSKMSWKVMVI
jgi:hypothetical protein